MLLPAYLSAGGVQQTGNVQAELAQGEVMQGSCFIAQYKRPYSLIFPLDAKSRNQKSFLLLF